MEQRQYDLRGRELKRLPQHHLGDHECMKNQAGLNRCRVDYLQGKEHHNRQ